MRKEILALITARGGSKGLPRKNLLPVGKKPLIWWSVVAALQSNHCSRTVVSTDCEEIRKTAVDAGAEAPFLRPAELAQDGTPGIDPVLHAVQWLADAQSYIPELVVLLQPTSPLRIARDIDDAIELVDDNAEAAVSVVPVSKHPNWMRTINNEGFLVEYLPKSELAVQRQKLPSLYALNGAIYVIKRDVLLSSKTFFPPRTMGYVMPVERSLDIDCAWDLKLADLVLSDGASR